MMDHAQWWLIALAFVLGLVLTFAFTIRRVKVEVPGTETTTAQETPTSELPEGQDSN